VSTDKKWTEEDVKEAAEGLILTSLELLEFMTVHETMEDDWGHLSGDEYDELAEEIWAKYHLARGKVMVSWDE
jgi:hypothetical protein